MYLCCSIRYSLSFGISSTISLLFQLIYYIRKYLGFKVFCSPKWKGIYPTITGYQNISLARAHGEQNKSWQLSWVHWQEEARKEHRTTAIESTAESRAYITKSNYNAKNTHTHTHRTNHASGGWDGRGSWRRCAPPSAQKLHTNCAQFVRIAEYLVISLGGT